MPSQIPDQLEPYAAYLARERRSPHALWTATQHIYENLRAQQPTQVFFQPPDTAFNGAGILRRRVH